MVMTALRDGASGGILKFFLLGILALAAGGLIFTDMGGFFRGGITSTDVAKAGNRNISVQQFDRTLRATLQRFGLSPQQAWKIGYVNEILKGEMRASLMEQEAVNLGVVVSDRIIAENIQDMIAPMIQPGQSPSVVLDQVLRSRGMSEQQMVGALRRDMNVNFVSNTMQSGFLPVSDILVKDVAAYERETRDLSFIVFKHSDIKDVEPADEAKLMEFYETTKETYAIPEMRKVTAVIIDNAKIRDTIEVADEELKAIYDRTIENYKVGERRNIEQVILSDAEQAEQVAAQVRDGKSLSDAVQDVSGNTTDLIPAKDVERTALLDELQEPVFEAEAKDILGPIETALGNHVVVVNAVKPAETTPFEKVKDNIKHEMLETRVLDAQYDLAASVDDFLAAGEAPEVIKEELGVETQSFPFASTVGIGENGQPVYNTAFGQDMTTVIGEINQLNEGEASQIMDLSDGRQVAFIIDEIKPKSYVPFEDVKAGLEKRYIEDSQREINLRAVKSLLDAAKTDESTLAELAKTNGKTVQKIETITRQDHAKGPLNKLNIMNVYKAQPYTLFSMELKDGAAIAIVTEIDLPEDIEEETAQSTESAIRQAQQKEAYDMYVGALTNKFSTNINHRLLESVYGPESQQY